MAGVEKLRGWEEGCEWERAKGLALETGAETDLSIPLVRAALAASPRYL